MESEYTRQELDNFNSTFCLDWIDTLDWKSSAKVAFCGRSAKNKQLPRKFCRAAV